MQAQQKSAGWAIGLRLAGLALPIASAGAIHLLLGLTHLGPLHTATPVEFLLALSGFACASAGVTLLVHGIHIFDQIEISDRWATRR